MGLVTKVDAWLWPSVDFRRAWTPRVTCGLSPAVCGRALLGFRVCSFIWMFVVQVREWARSPAPEFQLAFLTNDSMWLNILYFLTVSALTIHAAAVCGAAPRSRIARAVLVHGHRLSSTLLGIAVSWEVVVVILFWAMLYTGTGGRNPQDYYSSNVLIHGLVALPPLVDVLCGSVILHDRYLVIIVVAAFGYLLVNLGVTRSFRPVYPILKWNRGSDAILVLGAVAGVVLVYSAAAAVAGALEASARRGGRLSACGYHTARSAAASSQPQLQPSAVVEEAHAVATASVCVGQAKDGQAGYEPASSASRTQRMLDLAATDPWCESVPLQDSDLPSMPCATCRACSAPTGGVPYA